MKRLWYIPFGICFVISFPIVAIGMSVLAMALWCHEHTRPIYPSQEKGIDELRVIA